MKRRGFLRLLASVPVTLVATEIWTPKPMVTVPAAAKCRCGHMLGMHGPVDVNAIVADAARRLADDIDRRVAEFSYSFAGLKPLGTLTVSGVWS